MHTKHRTSLNIVKLYGRDVEIHLWECMLASMYMCMFRTLGTNFQDGSWIYHLMDFKSRRMREVFSQTGLHQEYYDFH